MKHRTLSTAVVTLSSVVILMVSVGCGGRALAENKPETPSLEMLKLQLDRDKQELRAIEAEISFLSVQLKSRLQDKKRLQDKIAQDNKAILEAVPKEEKDGSGTDHKPDSGSSGK